MSYNNSHSIRSVIKKVSKEGAESSYFLLGDDYFLQSFFIEKIKENASSGVNVDYFYLNDQMDTEFFFNSLNSMSLFDSKNIFIIKSFNKLSTSSQNALDEHFITANKNNILIFILDDFIIKNKFAKKISNSCTIINTQTPFNELKIKKWILYYFRNEAQEIEGHILDYFIKNYKNDISSIINEVEKYYLTTLSNKLKKKFNNSKYFSKHIKVWNLLDAIGEKNIKNSIDYYNNLYFNGYSLVPIIINLNNLFFELLCSYDVKSKINYSILNKTLQNKFTVYKNKYSKSEINKIFLELRNCDILIKTSSINDKNIFTSIIFKICSGYYHE